MTAMCSTNHAKLLVIVVSYGFLAITNPWLLQETIQSMAYEIVLHTQTYIKSKLMQILDHQNH